MALSSRSESTQAVDLFRGMPLSARQVDEVTFGAMLNACSTSDALPTVEEALDRMVQHGTDDVENCLPTDTSVERLTVGHSEWDLLFAYCCFLSFLSQVFDRQGKSWIIFQKVTDAQSRRTETK